MKLFLYIADTEPGDLNSQRGIDHHWNTIMKSGKDRPLRADRKPSHSDNEVSSGHSGSTAPRG
ncbi:MAG: hypothetical protein ACKVKT_00435 [Rhodospirillales bacterium]